MLVWLIWMSRVIKFNQGLSCFYKFILTDIYFHYLTIKLSFYHQLHLHRLHCQNWLSLLHKITCLLVHLCDCSGHRGLTKFICGSFLFNSLELISGKPKAELISLLIKDMHNVILNEVFLLTCLSIDDNFEYIATTLQDLVVVNLVCNSNWAVLGTISLNTNLKFKIMSQRSFMHSNRLYLILILHIFIVN